MIRGSITIDGLENPLLTSIKGRPMVLNTAHLCHGRKLDSTRIIGDLIGCTWGFNGIWNQLQSEVGLCTFDILIFGNAGAAMIYVLGNYNDLYIYKDLNNGGMAIVHRFVQNKDLTNSGHVNKLGYDGTLTNLTTLWGYNGVQYG